jgi:hypothetical protein
VHMRRIVIAIVHRNRHSEEVRDRGHGNRPLTRLARTKSGLATLSRKVRG